MSTCIVHSDEPITLLGGGEAESITINLALTIAPSIVAADGGANLAVMNHLAPIAVIGDFDSMTEETRAVLNPDTLHRIDEQDSTDFDKALRNINAPLVLAVGFTGARLDHQLAALNTLVAHPDQRCLIVGKSEVIFLCPPKLALSLSMGSVFSLFPIGKVSGHSSGLKWPIDGVQFSPTGRVGTSNEVVGLVELEFDAPRMLAIAQLSDLDQIVNSLLSSDARWPVRA